MTGKLQKACLVWLSEAFQDSYYVFDRNTLVGHCSESSKGWAQVTTTGHWSASEKVALVPSGVSTLLCSFPSRTQPSPLEKHWTKTIAISKDTNVLLCPIRHVLSTNVKFFSLSVASGHGTPQCPWMAEPRKLCPSQSSVSMKLHWAWVPECITLHWHIWKKSCTWTDRGKIKFSYRSSVVVLGYIFGQCHHTN